MSMIVATTKIAEKPINETIKPMPESIASLRFDWTSCSNSFIATPPNSILSIEESAGKIYINRSLYGFYAMLTQFVQRLCALTAAIAVRLRIVFVFFSFFPVIRRHRLLFRLKMSKYFEFE